MQDKTKRIEWIDVCKGLAMLAIFVGHSLPSNVITIFVYRYNVPLFFFLSGLFFTKRKNLTIKEYIIKSANGILVPYAFFCSLSMVFYIVFTSRTSGLREMIMQAITGSRNNISFGQQLWFLPCLFVIQIVYHLINKLIKRKKYVVAVVAVIALVSTVIFNNPYVKAAPFSFNLATYYIIFYCIGDVAYAKLEKFSFEGLRQGSKILISLFSLFIMGSTFLIYYVYNWIDTFINGISIKIIQQSIVILISLILITANIIISFALKNNRFLYNIGKNTIIYCGFESIAMIIALGIPRFFGLSVGLDATLDKVIFAMLKIILIYKIAVPLYDSDLQWSIGKRVQQNKYTEN